MRGKDEEEFEACGDAKWASGIFIETKRGWRGEEQPIRPDGVRVGVRRMCGGMFYF